MLLFKMMVWGVKFTRGGLVMIKFHCFLHWIYSHHENMFLAVSLGSLSRVFTEEERLTIP